jgi:murein DD-endopeptidase MepM/ murein hydrolase activator NlpD
MQLLPNVNSYTKNLLKSVKYVGINEIKETIPVVFEAKESNEEAINSIRTGLRNKNKIKAISNLAKDSDFYKEGSALLKNLKQSIKTGEFYSEKRTDAVFNEMMGVDFGDLDFDNDNLDESEDSINSNANSLNELNSDLDAGLEANATAIASTTVQSANYIGTTIKGSTTMLYAQGTEQTSLMRTGFASLDDSLKKIVSFNNDILNKHIKNATTFFENTSNLLTEQNAMIKEMLEMQRNLYKVKQKEEEENKYNKLTSYNGTVDLSKYFEHIKSNSKDYFEPAHQMLKMFGANPLELVIQGALGFVGSDSLKKSGKELNKTLSGVFGRYIKFLQDQDKKNGGIWSTLNSIFGISDYKKTTVDTGKYEKGPMQFNGIANKAITTVIPGYLARIEAALTGGDERYFSYGTGRWVDVKTIRKAYDKKIRSNNLDNGLTDLIDEMRGSLNKVNYNNYNGVKINSKDKTEVFNKMIKTIVDNGGYIDESFVAKDRKSGIDYKKLYKIFGFKEPLTDSQKAMIDVMATALANVRTSTKASLNNSVRRSKGANSEFMQQIENDPYSLFRILVNNQLEGTDNVRYALSDASLVTPKKGGIASFKIGASSNQFNESLAIKRDVSATLPVTDYSADIFYSVGTLDDFINLFKSSDRETVKAFIMYISNLDSINKLKENEKPVADFIKMSCKLDSDDFSMCKLYAEFIDYQKENKNSIKKFNRELSLISRNFYIFIYNISNKELISTSEALSKNIIDEINDRKTKNKYDEYNGDSLWDKLINAKGLEKIDVLTSYTKKLTSMPFDILGGVIAKTDKLIYDLFFGNQQIRINGKPVTGFFDVMVHKIGDAVEKLYKDIKQHIWGKEQWNQYKDAVYGTVKTGVKGFRSFFTDKSVKEVDSAAYGLGVVPKTDIYTLHKGEAVVPAFMNPDYTGTDINPAKHAKDEQTVAKKYGLRVKGYADGTVNKTINTTAASYEELWNVLKEKYPAMLGEATVGAVGGSIFGGPVGLITGASFAAANYILKNSEGANQILFGDSEKQSLFTRMNNGVKKVIPKKLHDYITNEIKKSKSVAKFTGLGALSGLMVGGPFGAVGGVILGGAVGLLKNYESARQFLFGDYYTKAKKIFNKKYFKSIGLGALSGLMVGGPFGAVGGAILGTVGQFASTSEKFRNWMFGKKDKNTGKRDYTSGYLGKLGEKILAPLKTLKDDILGYMNENVFQPISRAFIPMAGYTQLALKKITKTLTKASTSSSLLDLPFYKDLPRIMKGSAGKYIGHGLAGAAGGFMFGGPIGAVIGGVLGGASAYRIKDKTIASWFGKFGKWAGTVPRKTLDKVTTFANSRLISYGNMSSDLMSASERQDYMSKHNLSYKGTNGILFKQNDTALASASASELKTMKNTVELMKLVSDNPTKNRISIEGKLRNCAKSIPNLDHSTINEILSYIRNAVKNSDDHQKVENMINKITQCLREHGLSDQQINIYMKPIRIGISALSVNKETQKYAKNAISDQQKYLKNAFNFNIVDGDIDKAIDQVGSELRRREVDGETIEKESLTKGELAITNSNKKIEDTIKISNVYLAAITEYVTQGKITDQTQKLLTNFDANAGKIDIDKENKNITANKKIIDKLEGKIHDGKRLTKQEQSRYNNAKASYNKSQQKLLAYNKHQAVKKLKHDSLWGQKTGNLEYDATKVKPNYEDFIKQTGLDNEVTFEQFKAFSIKVDYNDIRSKIKYISPTVLMLLINTPDIDIFKFNRVYELAKYGIDLDPTVNGNGKNLSLILNLSDNIFKTRILDLLGMNFIFDSFEQIISLSDKDFNILIEIYDKGRKSGINYSQVYWVNLVDKISSGEIKREDVDESLTYEYAKNQLNNSKLAKSSKLLHNLWGKKSNKQKIVEQFEHASRGKKSVFSNSEEWYNDDKYLSAIQSNNKSDTRVVYSDSAKSMLTFRKTTDGGWSLISGDKDTKDGVARADEERNAILTLGEYAKRKLQVSKLKKVGTNLISKVKNTSLGKLFSGLKDIFKSAFGLGFDITGSLFNMIPGSSLLKQKAYQFAGNKLGKLGTKLADKATALGGAKGVLGKVGGKLLGGASFLIKNLADAATAAADAEASTPEFNTELDALQYIASKVSGTQAAVVASAQQAGLGFEDLMKTPLNKAKGTATSVGTKALETGTVATGFFANGWNKAKDAVTSVGTKALGVVGPVMGWVQNMLKKVFEFASKFLPSNLGSKVSAFCTAVLKKASNPKIAIEVAKKAAKKGIQLGLGPVGWAVMAGTIAYSFYNGYNNAESIWNDGATNHDTNLSMGEKALCGIASVVANEILLGIFTPSEILGIAKSIFGKIKGVYDAIKDKASDIADTVSNYKDKILDAGKELWNNVKTSFSNTWDNMKNSVADTISNMKDTLVKFKDNAVSAVTDALSKPYTWIKDKAKAGWNWLTGNSEADTLPNFNPGGDLGRGGPLTGDILRRFKRGIGGGSITPAEIWDILTTKYHYSNQAAAAIMGSMQQESSFNPNASQNGGGIDASISQGEGTNGFGLCQWTGSRTQALVDYCKSKSLDPTSAEGQISFMNYEMGQRGSNSAFNNAGSLDAALQVMKAYEGYGEIGQREEYAKQIFQNQGKGLASAGSVSGSSSGTSSSSPIDNSLFGKIDQAFKQAFAPYNSIFGNLFGSNDSSSSSSSSSSNSSASNNAGAAASDMSGDIDSGSTADKLIANLKSVSRDYVEVTAPYGEANHMGHTHGGIDIAAPEGTPIKSPIAGTVIDNNYGGGYGNYVQIKDKNNMDHLFPHMSSPSPLANGTQVSIGDTVGYVGSTGNSTGPHVHYEIDDDTVNPGATTTGAHINPGKYMGGPLSGDNVLKFRKKVNDLANAGNKAAAKIIAKGYATDHIAVGGPVVGESLNNYNTGLNNKDYSGQLNQIISLLSIIANAVQNQVSTAVSPAINSNNNGGLSTSTTSNSAMMNILKNMGIIASN